MKVLAEMGIRDRKRVSPGKERHVKKELFVSDKCAHCITLMATEDFDQRFADYEIHNITNSMAELKVFLAYRDSLAGYDEIKKAGKVGVPSVVQDGQHVLFVGEV